MGKFCCNCNDYIDSCDIVDLYQHFNEQKVDSTYWVVIFQPSYKILNTSDRRIIFR